MSTKNDEPPNNKIAALLGNGLSITADSGLAIPSLTAEIADRYNSIARSKTGPVERVLGRLAERGSDTGEPRTDFEAMIGPLDQQRENMGDLEDLAELVGKESPAVRTALRTVSGFVEVLRRHGVGHALEVIADRSVADFERRKPVSRFLDAVVNEAAYSRLTIGNLSYDSLVLASLVENYGHRLCDMADGRPARTKKINLYGEGAVAAQAHRLRETLVDFPGARYNIRLAHLHGSLTWLRDPDTGIVYRFPIEYLRGEVTFLDGEAEYTDSHWTRWRTKKSEWEPQVVLTNQSAKSKIVKEPPFSLAYDVLFDALVDSDRWVIAGYSFRDEAINDLMAEAWDKRRNVPNVLVVTKGDALREIDILDAVGWNLHTDPHPQDILRVYRDGVESAPASPEWATWANFGNPALDVVGL